MNIDEEGFDEGRWRKLIDSGHEKYIDDDLDRGGRKVPKPPLHNEWLTKREIEARNQECRRRWFSGNETSSDQKNEPSEKSKVQFKDNVDNDK